VHVPGRLSDPGIAELAGGFLPGVYQGTYIDTQHTELSKLIENVQPRRIRRRAAAAARSAAGAEPPPRAPGSAGSSDAALDARIQSFELAYRMQMDAADAFDVSREPQNIREMYGEGVQARQTADRPPAAGARRALRAGLARRRPAVGQPRRPRSEPPPLAKQCDQAIGALLKDLKQRGMLEDTLVIWGGEFGRTPTVELPTPGANAGKVNGRDHNHYGFSMWLAGGGVKGGHVHGATDEFGFKAAEDPVHVHDLHATILHLLGLRPREVHLPPRRQRFPADGCARACGGPSGLSLRKARGAFFTPPAVSRFLTNWAIRTPTDRALEPSCGEASFLLSAASKLRELKGKATPLLFDPFTDVSQLVGVEIHAASAKTASDVLGTAGSSVDILVRDFFEIEPAADFDVVMGNPPFVRYQNFTGDARQKGLRAALAAGVNLSGLASSWAPFLVHSCRFLKPNGRLGMVLPAELLAVHYAAPVRRFLLERFASLRIVVFERLLFQDALEDVVLLMAEGTGGCNKIEVVQVRDAGDLDGGSATTVAAKHLRDDRWVATLVKPDAWQAFTTFAESAMCERLRDWGTTYLGAVTGENDFFCLSDSQVADAGLRECDLLRISPPGSRHLRTLEFGARSWSQLRTDGRRCWLFYPSSDTPSKAAAAYIEAAEHRSIHKNYKCRMRNPWWRVPLVAKPDLFLTYMDYERPRLITNSADAYHLNSLYGVKLKRGRKQIGCELLPLASLNTVSLLGAEVHGRSYGGGLLKLEPREADRIPVPILSLVQQQREQLLALRPQVAYAMERGDLAKAVTTVDEVLWSKDQTTGDVLDTLRQTREFLFQRRSTRSRGGTDE
jgi:adenine-specific DNA-methyltransferase